jgi:hypothetical protein
MARKKASSDNELMRPAELLVTREEARSRLEERIRKGREIKAAHILAEHEYTAARNEYHKWDSFNDELLKRVFTTEEFAKEYSWFGMSVSHLNPSLEKQISDLHKDIDERIHRIDSIIERLELIPLVATQPSLGSVIQEKDFCARERGMQLIDLLKRQITERNGILSQTPAIGSLKPHLDRWEERTAKILLENYGEKEAEEFKSYSNSWLISESKWLVDTENYLLALIKDIEDHPEAFARLSVANTVDGTSGL